MTAWMLVLMLMPMPVPIPVLVVAVVLVVVLVVVVVVVVVVVSHRGLPHLLRVVPPLLPRASAAREWAAPLSSWRLLTTRSPPSFRCVSAHVCVCACLCVRARAGVCVSVV